MLSVPTDDKLKSLARTVARGRSATSWANRHNITVEAVDEWRALPEFSELIEAYRLRVVDRMTGKLTMQSTVAIDDLFDTFTRSPSYSAKQSSGRALVDNWLRISLRFEARRKLAEFNARMTKLEQQEHGGGAQPRP